MDLISDALRILIISIGFAKLITLFGRKVKIFGMIQSFAKRLNHKE
ncbi:hypothetical protein [Anaerotignum sp.]|nr:hypothetical protein [Anaerotignum sp.]